MSFHHSLRDSFDLATMLYAISMRVGLREERRILILINWLEEFPWARTQAHLNCFKNFCE